MTLNKGPGLERAFQRTEHPYLMWDGLESTPEAIEDILSRPVQELVQEAASQINEKEILQYVGCGTSYYSSLAGIHALHQLTEKLGVAHVAHAFAAYPPPLAADQALIAVSHSGSTPPVIEGVKAAKDRRVPCLAITDDPDSTLAALADFTLMGRYGVEPALPKTRSFVTTLLRHYLLVLALADLDQRTEKMFRQQLAGLPDAAARILEANRGKARNLAQQFKGVRRIVVVGGGPQYATALEASLKLTEAASVLSVAWEVEEAGHGLWASSEAGDLAIVLAANGPSQEKAANVGRALDGIDMPVWYLSEQDHPGDWATAQTGLGSGLTEWIMPALTILPLYQFSYWLAVEKGLNPDTMRLDQERRLWTRTMMRHPEQVGSDR